MSLNPLKIFNFLKKIFTTIRDLNSKMSRLEESVNKQETKIKELSNLCSDILDDVKHMKGKYEGIDALIDEKIKNKFLSYELQYQKTKNKKLIQQSKNKLLPNKKNDCEEEQED